MGKYSSRSPGGSNYDKHEGPAPAGGKTVHVTDGQGNWGKGVGTDRDDAESKAFDDLHDNKE